MTRKPTPPSPLIMISAPCTCLISRICLLTLLRSPGEKPSKMPTGLRSIGAILLLEQVRKLPAQKLLAWFLSVSRHQDLHALVPGLGQRFGGVAVGMDGLSDRDLDPLAQPDVLGAREGDGNDRHAGLDREMCEPLLEGHQLALLRSVVALGKDRHRAADLERPVNMLEKRLV